VLYLFPVSDNTNHKTIYLYIIGLECQTERCNYLIIGLLISSWSFVFFMTARIVLSHCVTELSRLIFFPVQAILVDF